jgi:Amt family ammonium transporter
MLLDQFHTRKTTAVGAATGIVVGLVAVTPAAGFIGPMSALALGAIAAVPSYYAIMKRIRTRLDDSLEVAGAHGLGGVVGAVLTGVFATAAWGGVDGLIGGAPRQVLVQGVAVLAAAAYSGVMSFLLLKAIALVMPLRATDSEEAVGLDVPLHGEEAYAHGDGAILLLPSTGERPTPATAGLDGLVETPA